MQNQQEMQGLESELRDLRESVSGLGFAEASDRFKDIESVKVRMAVLRNPNFYREKYGKPRGRMQ